MRIEYSRAKGKNFGDDLNLWLWPKLIGECLGNDDNTAFLGIGTILSQHMFNQHLSTADKIVVFSSGSADKPAPRLNEKWNFYCVRGPRTAQKNNLPPEYGIGDGAYLLRSVELPPSPGKQGVAFIPHHRSEKYIDWGPVCKKAGIRFITPMQDVENFLAEIQTCEKVIAEAMHGAITADALRIPWVPVRFAPNFCEEKWLDFFESIRVVPNIESLPIMYQKRLSPGRLIQNAFKKGMSKIFPCPDKWSHLPVSMRLAGEKQLDTLVSRLEHTAKKPEAILSTDSTVASVTEKLNEQLENVKQDYRAGKLF